MRVTIAKSFTLEVDYDEAYLIHQALAEFDAGVTTEGAAIVATIRRQLLALISLASGADADAVPFRPVGGAK